MLICQSLGVERSPLGAQLSSLNMITTLNARRSTLLLSLTLLCAFAVAQSGSTPATTAPPTATTAATSPEAQPSTSVTTGNIVPGYLMATPPKIDGVLEDGEWGSVPTFSGLVDASNGGTVPYQGTFWLGYDS